MTVYRPTKPIAARRPAQGPTESLYRPRPESALAGRRKGPSDTIVIAALTVAATVICAYDLCMFALHS